MCFMLLCKRIIQTIIGGNKRHFARLDTKYYFNHKAHVNSLYSPVRKDFPMNKQWIHLTYARIRMTDFNCFIYLHSTFTTGHLANTWYLGTCHNNLHSSFDTIDNW